MSKLFDVNNVLITLKAVVVGIIVGLVGWLLSSLDVGGKVLTVAWFVFALFLWGYLANRWWNWR